MDIQIEEYNIKNDKKSLNFTKITGLNNKPEDFKVYHHKKPLKENNYSYTKIEVLSELIGVKWCYITMCYVLSLEPLTIRVSNGAVTADACRNRITVIIDNNDIITKIYKEVSIPCPDGMCGYDLENLLNRLKKESKK